jgi:hypothetical protein
MENRHVPAYVIETLGLTPGEQSHLMAVKGAKHSADPVSTVACGFKHLDHKPTIMRTMVNDNKFFVDDHCGVVYVLAKYDRFPRVLDKCIVQVDEFNLCVYKVKSIIWKTDSCKAFMDIPVRIKVYFS